jgi:hypothetical protein
MTTEQFAIWLNGFFELSEEKKLSEKQVTIIKDHLALVFEKVTPDRSAPAPKGLDATSTSKRVKINMDSILEKKQIVPEGISKTPQSHIGFNVKKNTIYC